MLSRETILANLEDISSLFFIVFNAYLFWEVSFSSDQFGNIASQNIKEIVYNPSFEELYELELDISLIKFISKIYNF